ncbi:hypothetical protein FS749_004759 [Ceratobasidium sp. UAMH 11750]|nr:hypothetical protein FS749_004759 [Ceratobasidium sp. UAMH 11750]
MAPSEQQSVEPEARSAYEREATEARASPQSQQSMPGALPMEEEPTIVIGEPAPREDPGDRPDILIEGQTVQSPPAPEEPTILANEGPSRQIRHTRIHNEASDDLHDGNTDNEWPVHPLNTLPFRRVVDSRTGSPRRIWMPPAERAINQPIQQAIEAINNSAITASEISEEEVNRALTPAIPAPPYAPPPPAARPQPVLSEEEEAVIRNAVGCAMQPWVHEVAQRVLLDIAALREQLTDVRDRHVVGERRLEGLETRLNTNNEHTVRAHHVARDALNMSTETFNALRPIATAIGEILGLLGAMQRIIERNTEALKAIHEGNEIN